MGDLHARSVMKREVIMQKLRRSGSKPADTVQRERGSYSTCRASASPVHQCISVLQTRQVPPPTRILVVLTVSSLDRDNTVPLTACNGKAMTSFAAVQASKGSLNMVVSQEVGVAERST